MMQRSRAILVYGASLAASICIFLFIRYLGHSLVAVEQLPQSGVRAIPSETSSVWIRVLVALIVVLGVARAVGAIFRLLNQPQVMGEVVAGILLGPSFFGWLAPEVASQVISVSVAPYLAV